MASESLLNNYYNRGGYNQPSRIGFMMKMIRNLKPLTQEEWEIWYLENVHDEEYLDGLAQEMCDFIPDQYHVSFSECKNYIYDVMFRRTFSGYNRENQPHAGQRQRVSIRQVPQKDAIHNVVEQLHDFGQAQRNRLRHDAGTDAPLRKIRRVLLVQGNSSSFCVLFLHYSTGFPVIQAQIASAGSSGLAPKYAAISSSVSPKVSCIIS